MAKDDITANPGYALGQIAHALTTSQTHGDAATRERARAKIAAWQGVFAGMLSGDLSVGSRTPVNAPAWATLQVIKGGFATGALLAGGPLHPHEVHRLARLRGAPPSAAPAASGDAARGALNASYLDDAGLAELQGLLRSGCYRIDVPEEGALLAVAWLVQHGHGDAARQVLEAIGPFLPRLRFYPIPSAEPLRDSSVVHVQTVGEVIDGLEATTENQRALSQREAVTVWGPLLDRAVALFVDTLEGPPPTLELGVDGQPARGADGRYTILGGWPCQQYPAGWRERAQAWLADFVRLRQAHTLCGKPERPHENLPRLRALLTKCVADPRSLSGREVGIVRLILAKIDAARGLPHSARLRELRAAQAQRAALPTRRERALLVAERLRTYPRDGGLPELDAALQPITEAEAARRGYPAGQALPVALRGRLMRCLDAPLEELVAKRAIPSGEVLARVVPQMTAQVGAAGIADPELRRLYRAVYHAFRRRRSLLLLNLQSQVRIEELPWVAAMASLRVEDQATRAAAGRALTELVRLAVTAWPQVILPNKLLQEVRALAERAGLKLPVVDEIAADIFMGEFTAKYVEAAKDAARLLEGTLYARYYGLPCARVQQMKVEKSRWGTTAVPALHQLCVERAEAAAPGTAERTGRSVAHNGRILEQEQILTTHNLATLFQALGLLTELAPELPALARRVFQWMCAAQRRPLTERRARLHRRKNLAYGWRQLMFYLALASEGEPPAFVDFARAELLRQPDEVQKELAPILGGLARVVTGGEAGPDVFLGWSAPRAAG